MIPKEKKQRGRGWNPEMGWFVVMGSIQCPKYLTLPYAALYTNLMYYSYRTRSSCPHQAGPTTWDEPIITTTTPTMYYVELEFWTQLQGRQRASRSFTSCSYSIKQGSRWWLSWWGRAGCMCSIPYRPLFSASLPCSGYVCRRDLHDAPPPPHEALLHIIQLQYVAPGLYEFSALRYKVQRQTEA